MPFTPFIGFSAIVHISIIIGHNLFNRMANKKMGSKKTTKLMQFLGVLIALAIFSIVITTATVLVYASLTDKHSTFHFLSHHFLETSWSLPNVNNTNNSNIASPTVTSTQPFPIQTGFTQDVAGLYNDPLMTISKKINGLPDNWTASCQ